MRSNLKPLAALFLTFVLLLAGVDRLTENIAADNADGQRLAALYAVMPGAEGFEEVGAAEGLPETVQGLYRETSGLGYGLLLSTDQGYTGKPIELAMAVDMDGRIAGIELTGYAETKDFGPDYPASYVGQDAALADVELATGVTYSSAAFKGAVIDGFAALTDNGLIRAVVKEDVQLLEELLPKVYPGIADRAGMAQVEEVEGDFDHILRAMVGANGAGCAYIVRSGEEHYLVVCNLSGGVKVYNVAGEEISGKSGLEDVLAEVRAHAEANLEPVEKAPKKLRRMVSDGAEFSQVDLQEVFSSVVFTCEIREDGEVHYGFVCRPFGYNGLPMEVYLLLDDAGAIVDMNADELIFFSEYFSDYELDESSYRTGFKGLTAEDWSGEQALITGATFTSDGVAVAVEDAFDAFEWLDERGGRNE